MNKEEATNIKIKDYIDKNIHYYNELEQLYLNGLDIKTIRSYSDDLPDIYRQILEEIGYYDDCIEKSGYNAFINILDKEFDINQNIIEIGGGMIPTLAHKISLKQQKGSITIYDPRLSNYYKATKKFILKKEKFNKNTDITSSNILIGFMPCEATQTIIEKAINNNKDFLIALCEGGPHGDEFDYYEDEEEWLESMLYIAERGVKEKNMGELQVVSFKDYNSPYPLIYNKRKQ